MTPIFNTKLGNMDCKYARNHLAGLGIKEASSQDHLQILYLGSQEKIGINSAWKNEGLFLFGQIMVHL